MEKSNPGSSRGGINARRIVGQIFATRVRSATSASALNFAFLATFFHPCQRWSSSTVGEGLPCSYAETKLARDFGRDQWTGGKIATRESAVSYTRRYELAATSGRDIPCILLCSKVSVAQVCFLYEPISFPCSEFSPEQE